MRNAIARAFRVALVLILASQFSAGTAAGNPEDLSRPVALAKAADQLGVGPADLERTSEGVIHPYGMNPGFYVATYLRTDEPFADDATTTVWVDLHTMVAYDQDGFEEATASARNKLGKFAPDVRTALDRLSDDGTLTVAVTYASDWRNLAVDAVKRDDPTATIVDGRPAAATDAENRRISASLRDRRKTLLAVDAAAIGNAASVASLKVDYVSRYLPMVWLTGTRAAIEAFVDDDRVTSVLGSYGTVKASWSDAYYTDGADYAYDNDLRGANTSIAVVEYGNVDWSTSDLSSLNVYDQYISLSTGACCFTSAHPTWVMEAIASQDASRRGIAPDAYFISSGTGQYQGVSEAQDYEIIEAIENALDYILAPADVINLSLVQDTGQNGNEALGDGAQALAAYLDNLVDTEHVHVAGAGGNNYGASERQCSNDENMVQSPGSSWNVLAAGILDPNHDSDWSNDSIYYYGNETVPGFCAAPPPGNPGDPLDRVKPEIAAPGTDISLGGGCCIGTSIATPQVAATMAVLIGEDPSDLRSWPEVVRSIIVAATRFHQTPGGTQDDEGWGSLYLRKAVRIVDKTKGDFGHEAFAGVGSGPYTIPGSKYEYATPGAGKARFVISWNSHGYFVQTGSTSASYYDRRMSRFKCRVRDETTLQIVAASTRTTPNMQVCNWTAVAGHEYRMEIKPLEWDPGLESEEVGWAFVH